MRKVIRLFEVTENQTSPGVWSIIERSEAEVRELARVIAGASGFDIMASARIDELGAWEFEVEDLVLPDPEHGKFDELPQAVKDAEKSIREEVNNAVWNETDQIKTDEAQGQ